MKTLVSTFKNAQNPWKFSKTGSALASQKLTSMDMALIPKYPFELGLE